MYLLVHAVILILLGKWNSDFKRCQSYNEYIQHYHERFAKRKPKKIKALGKHFSRSVLGPHQVNFQGTQANFARSIGCSDKIPQSPTRFSASLRPQAPSSREPSDYSLCLILLSTSMPWKLPVYPNTAPQLGHRRCRMMRQQRMPMGKKKIAQHTPRQVKSSSKTPVWKDIGIKIHRRAIQCDLE